MRQKTTSGVTIGLGNHGVCDDGAVPGRGFERASTTPAVDARVRANQMRRVRYRATAGHTGDQRLRANRQVPGTADPGPFSWDRTRDGRLDNDMCNECNTVLLPWETEADCAVCAVRALLRPHQRPTDSVPAGRVWRGDLPEYQLFGHGRDRRRSGAGQLRLHDHDPESS